MDGQVSPVEHIIKSYLQATREVLESVLDSSVDAGQVSIVNSPVDIREVAVILGITGDAEGRVLLEFQLETALQVATCMNYGEHFETLDSMARATLSELGNMIGGRAVTVCRDTGTRVTISPPMLVCGLGIRTSDPNPVRRITVNTNFGEVLVNLSLRPSQSRVSPWSGATALTSVKA